MKANIQQHISPMSNIGKSTSPDLSIPSKPAIDSNADEKPEIDFRSLLMNSNDQVKEQREAKNKGALENADSYEDFLSSLNKQTNNQRVPNNSLGKDDFLKLFVTQLQAQDPLKPKDGTDMAAQMAQFNSVEQMINFNKGLERIEQATKSNHSTGFVNYIGKDVTVKGGRVNLTKAGIGHVNFNSPKDVVSATLEIRDEGGSVVKTKELGQVPAGDHLLGWDGLSEKGEVLPLGSYTFNIKGNTINGEDVKAEITTNLKITGVDLSNDDPHFFTDLGKLKPNEIAAIGETGFANKAQQLAQDQLKAQLALAEKAKAEQSAQPNTTQQLDNSQEANELPQTNTIIPSKADKHVNTKDTPVQEQPGKEDPIPEVPNNQVADLPNTPASQQI